MKDTERPRSLKRTNTVAYNFRLLDSTGYLWVDQICINQDNTAERNYQVGIMGKIYQAGHQILVWLGPI